MGNYKRLNSTAYSPGVFKAAAPGTEEPPSCAFFCAGTGLIRLRTSREEQAAISFTTPVLGQGNATSKGEQAGGPERRQPQSRNPLHPKRGNEKGPAKPSRAASRDGQMPMCLLTGKGLYRIMALGAPWRCF